MQNSDRNKPEQASPPTATKGVQTLLGNPKKAIIKLSIPMIVAMSVHTLYNFVDGLWVSGLGPDALSAVGFFFPFFFMVFALAAGIGVGGSSAISRRIGAHDKKNADAVASHTMVMMLITTLIITVPFIILAPKIFAAMGAGHIVPTATAYARILFAGTLIIMFGSVASAILRGEGDVKRAMIIMMLGAGLNIILDPIFIYLLKLGVVGAAWATMVSLCVTSAFLFHWLFIKRDTYVSISFHKFRFRKDILKDILRVGIPSSIMQMSMALAMLIVNLIAVKVGGTDGVAVFTTGWRVVMFATLPLIGIATAVTSITAAAYGGKAYQKLDTAYMYSIKIGASLSLITAVITYFLAPSFAWLFTTAGESVRIRSDLITFLHTMCFFYPGVAFGMFSSAMFQGTGRGIISLTVTIIRTIILAIPLAYLFAVVMDMGLGGIWWGMTAGNLVGSVIAFSWGRHFIRKLLSNVPASEISV